MTAAGVLALLSIVVPMMSGAVRGQEPSNPTAQPMATETAIVAATATPMPTLLPTSTPMPTETQIPLCPPVGAPVVFGEISVIFHEPVSAQACDDVLTYVRNTNNAFASLGYSTGPMEIAVFATIDMATDYTYETTRLAGCNPDSKDGIRGNWERGGALSTKGAAFFLVDPQWDSAQELEKANPIVHEITQVTIKNILGSCQRTWTVPDWFTTGLAEYHAEIFTTQWGMTQFDEDLYRCHERLGTLAPSNGDCVYMEAQMAFHLLKEKYGVDKGLDVMLAMQSGSSFNSAFAQVYGISVSQFSAEFDAYREAGYKLPSGDG